MRHRGRQRRSDKGGLDPARKSHREFARWVRYFSVVYQSAPYPTLGLIEAHLQRWVKWTFKRFRHCATRTLRDHPVHSHPVNEGRPDRR